MIHLKTFLHSLIDFSILLLLDLQPVFATSYTLTIAENPSKNKIAPSIFFYLLLALLITHSATTIATIPNAIPQNT